jgi:hypothetical protein
MTEPNPGLPSAQAERSPQEPSEHRSRTTLRVRTGGSDRTLESFVPTPAKRPNPNNGPVVEAILAVLNSRITTFAPGTVLGAGVYLQSGQVREALLTCLLVPPTVAGGKVLAEWVRLLSPPKRWRRPRRRGS